MGKGRDPLPKTGCRESSRFGPSGEQSHRRILAHRSASHVSQGPRRHATRADACAQTWEAPPFSAARVAGTSLGETLVTLLEETSWPQSEQPTTHLGTESSESTSAQLDMSLPPLTALALHRASGPSLSSGTGYTKTPFLTKFLETVTYAPFCALFAAG